MCNTQKQKWNQWQQSHHVTGNTVTSDQVVQNLILGREPAAQVTLSVRSGRLIPESEWTRYDWGTPNQQKADNVSIGNDGKAYVIRENGAVNGKVLTATYTGLSNSFYVDRAGTKHKIAKIVRTFSDLTDSGITNWAKHYGVNNPEEYNHGNPELTLYSDPTDGFWYNWSGGVTVQDLYYDNNGQPININGNAWLAVTSLNNESSGPTKHEHIESVEALSNGTAYSLAGSSIQKVGINKLYSPTDNTYTGPILGDDWDRKDSKEKYYGAGLINISNGVTLRFYTQRDSGNITPNVWATTSTIIPMTPTPRAAIHYHYDVIAKRYLSRTISVKR